MTIQKIVPPGQNLKSLYIKELDSLKREKEFFGSSDIDITFPMNLKKGDIISFETYVNALSIEKWTSYTNVKSIGIRIRSTKEIKIQIYNSTGVYDWDNNGRYAGKKEVESEITCEDKREYREYSIEIKDKHLSGIIYPIIEAIDDCELLGGEYISNNTGSAKKVKPCFVVNYNRDANKTRQNINAIRNNSLYDNELIIVSDMTGKLSKEVFIDNSHVCSKIIQIPTSQNIGKCYNEILRYISYDVEEDYTHAFLIDSDVILDSNACDRLISFISLLDDVRNDMIIQGDVLSDDSLVESSGYIIRDNKPSERFNGFDMTKPSDFVVLSTSEEVDYFKFGLLLVPLNQIKAYNPDLRTNVEFDYYLHHKSINVTNINGFFGVRENKESRGVVWDKYYRYRDYFIAIVDSEYELDKTEFRMYIDKEMKMESKKGNMELAFSILEATNDFLNGPEGLYDEYCLEEIRDRLKELTQRFNDSIVGRKNIIKDRLELQKFYNKICLKIDHDYDMIIDKWTESKRKVDDEREQQ